MCGFSASFRIGTAARRQHERAADVDVLHEVVLLRGELERAGQVDHRRVVDDDVDAAELALGLQHRLGDVVVVAHVADDRQRAAGRLDLGRGLCTVPSSFGCGVSVLAMSAMFAPSRAARSAIARPMPRLPPT
jgi:hypothetical protein